MDTFLVEFVLIGWDVVALHVLCVGMAVGAGFRHVCGINRRACIGRGTDVMHTVAIHAYGDLCVALFQAFPMNAGVVFVYLIGSKAGVELPHVIRI